MQGPGGREDPNVGSHWYQSKKLHEESGEGACHGHRDRPDPERSSRVEHDMLPGELHAAQSMRARQEKVPLQRQLHVLHVSLGRGLLHHPLLNVDSVSRLGNARSGLRESR